MTRPDPQQRVASVAQLTVSTSQLCPSLSFQ